MRIIRYLKGHIGALVLIIALLVVQAFADLSLPRYTSDLVDVGIQQGGIDRPSPSEFTADTFEAVCMLASPDGGRHTFFLRRGVGWLIRHQQEGAGQSGRA